MGPEDSEQQISGNQLLGTQLPPSVEAVIQFGYSPDLVYSTYQQLSTESLCDVIQSASVATGGGGCDHVNAALLLTRVQNVISSQFSGSLTQNDVSRSRTAVTCYGGIPVGQVAGDLQDDGPRDGIEASPHSASRQEGEIDADREDSSGNDTTTTVQTTSAPTQAPLPTTTNASTADSSAGTAPRIAMTAAEVSTDTTASTSSAATASSAHRVEVAATVGTTSTTSTDAATACPDQSPRPQTNSDGAATHPLSSSTVTPNGVDLGDVTDDKARERRRQLERLRALREENRRLKARNICHQCHQRPVALTFLPCGHFCFCNECGSSFNACPLCRKTILADVRTFVS